MFHLKLVEKNLHHIFSFLALMLILLKDFQKSILVKQMTKGILRLVFKENMIQKDPKELGNMYLAGFPGLIFQRQKEILRNFQV